MVEGVERAIRGDCELEAVSDPRVLDDDAHGVLPRVPEQEDEEAIALAGSELSSSGCFGGHLPLPSGLLVRSWDLYLADAADGRALCDVVGEQPERVRFGLRLDRPPDRVSAGAARGERRPVAKRALMPLERGEDDAALMRLVAVLEQVLGHGSSLPPSGSADIGRHPEHAPRSFDPAALIRSYGRARCPAAVDARAGNTETPATCLVVEDGSPRVALSWPGAL